MKAEERGPEVVKLIKAHETSTRLAGEHKVTAAKKPRAALLVTVGSTGSDRS